MSPGKSLFFFFFSTWVGGDYGRRQIGTETGHERCWSKISVRTNSLLHSLVMATGGEDEEDAVLSVRAAAIHDYIKEYQTYEIPSDYEAPINRCLLELKRR